MPLSDGDSVFDNHMYTEIEAYNYFIVHESIKYIHHASDIRHNLKFM